MGASDYDLPNSLPPVSDEPTVLLDADAAPAAPGCYIMRDKIGTILYVGKACNLRARLRNYINATDSRYSVKFLMRRAATVEFIVVDSEKEALLLENTLIKKHKPKYNVRLRDDKNYISIRLHPDEPFPRMTVVRRHKHDGARYFGPYHDTQAARKTLKQLQSLFPLRVCSDHVMHNRARPCIYYQIKQCLAPCVGLVGAAAYDELVRQVLLILEGRTKDLERELLRNIKTLSERLQFEEAAVLRDRLRDLQATVQPQRAIVHQGASDKDVFGVYSEGRFIEIQVLNYRNNAMTGAKSFPFDRVEMPVEELFGSFLLQYYDAMVGVPAEIIVPYKLESGNALSSLLSEKRGGRVRIIHAQRGVLYKLVALAAENARNAFRERCGKEKALRDALEDVRDVLHLSTVPERMECFDISTIQGNKTVAAMAVFEDGQPAKKRYRRYEIRGLEGQDDFEAMREVLRRRYTRAKEENDLPDLVLIDGGKGHLNVAVTVLRDLGLDRLGCASIAKSRTEGDSGHSPERFFIPGRANPIVPPQQSPAVLLLSGLRDETHRFAITYHRLKRKKATLTTVLLEIPGVGKHRAQVLLSHFGSMSRLREAVVEQVAAVPGISGKLAQDIVSALRSNK